MISYKENKVKFILISTIFGLLVGFLNGFFGGGGGMVVVPVLIFLMGFVEKKAHASAIFVILPLCIASSIIYATTQDMEWLTLLYCTIGVIVGGIAGAFILPKINNKAIRVIFALIMIGAGIKLIV